MYKNILIPTDGSPAADQGAEHGLKLAKALQAKTVAIIVTEPFTAASFSPVETAVLEETVDEINAATNAAAEQRLRSLLVEATTLGVACETRHIASHRPPAQGILEAASDEDCDLIVMATRGTRGWQRIFLGSQALEVVTRAAVPVLIFRPPSTPDGTRAQPNDARIYSNILIATDGSHLAQKAVEHGLLLAQKLRSSVTFVVASGFVAGMSLEGVAISPFSRHAGVVRATEAAAERVIEQCDQRASKLGVVHEQVHVRNAVASDAILSTADGHHCDLIVMASHGYRGIDWLLLGSQAHDVVGRSTVPVLVVR